MTSIPLHSMPRWRSVASEQVRAVGLMTWKAGLALSGLLIVLLIAVVQASYRARDLRGMQLRAAILDITSAPWAALGAIVAALFAFAMWREEDPDRRSYHWMMPAEPHVHTLTKVLAGWVWLLAATAVSLAVIASIDALSTMITGYQQLNDGFGWWWLLPLTSVTVAYVLVSAAAVGTRQPVMWVAGVIVLYSASLLALDVLGYRGTHDVVRMALSGEYGIGAAVAGDIERMDTAQLHMVPSVGRWLGATALWGGVGAMLLVATAYRRAEPTVAGAHGPFGLAILGHAWLVASVIALSMAAGVVAARVAQPEYEVRATIWNRAEASSVVMTMVPEPRSTKLPNLPLLLTTSGIADTVVQRLSLYVRPDVPADSTLLKGFTIGDRFVPGDYRFAVNDSGTRWQLRVVNLITSDRGVAGDSIGRTVFGLRWRPEPTTLARFAGREVGFTVVSPRQAAVELLAHMTVVQAGYSSFVLLTLTDPDPQRAARVLNAVAIAYINANSSREKPLSILDSAVAPPRPFKSSAGQLIGMSLVLGIIIAIALALAASALEGRLMRP